jgi:hypothetical protein
MSTPSDGIFWPFVRGLKWLRPGVTSTMEQVHRQKAVEGGKGIQWLEKSLQEHTLSSQIETLVSDKQHLHYHYEGRLVFNYSQICFNGHLPLTAICALFCFCPSMVDSLLKQSVLNGHLPSTAICAPFCFCSSVVHKFNIKTICPKQLSVLYSHSGFVPL